MLPARLAIFLAFFLIGSVCIFQIFAASSEKAQTLAPQTVLENSVAPRQTISELRAMGAEGLKTLFEVYAAEIKSHFDGKDPADWERITTELDTVAMQKNAVAARLYWYTDFEKAKQVAQKENKPILSLRLLGNLNEELSCANSRFFRTVLYSNAEISKILRERFILHWQSVRPAPRITIDFGDGRKIERTVTGNSIHYLLNSDGQLLDALPGLYSPTAFSAWLSDSKQVFQKYNVTEDILRPDFLRNFHRSKNEKIERRWREDLAKVGVNTANKLAQDKTEDLSAQNLSTVSATRAANNAIGKNVVQSSSVKAFALPSTQKLLALEKGTNIGEWQKIAELHLNNSRLDANSLALMRRQTKLDEANFARLISNFESYLAIDTLRNEYVYHSKLHTLLAASFFTNNLDEFNDLVYASLFLTPKSDAWLGLYSPDVYAALDGNGVK